jgi:hypothetical protein
MVVPATLGVLVQVGETEGPGVGEGTGLSVGVEVSVGSSAGGGVQVSVGGTRIAPVAGLAESLVGLEATAAVTDGNAPAVGMWVSEGDGAMVD